MSVYFLGWNKYFCYSLTVYATVLMIVEAASSEITPSLSRSAMSPVLALSIADQPLLKLGLSRFCSEKAKNLLRNMPKSCSKVTQN